MPFANQLMKLSLKRPYLFVSFLATSIDVLLLLHLLFLALGLGVLSNKQNIVATDEDLSDKLLLFLVILSYNLVGVVKLKIHVIVDG